MATRHIAVSRIYRFSVSLKPYRNHKSNHTGASPLKVQYKSHANNKTKSTSHPTRTTTPLLTATSSPRHRHSREPRQRNNHATPSSPHLARYTNLDQNPSQAQGHMQMRNPLAANSNAFLSWRKVQESGFIGFTIPRLARRDLRNPHVRVRLKASADATERPSCAMQGRRGEEKGKMGLCKPSVKREVAGPRALDPSIEGFAEGCLFATVVLEFRRWRSD